MRTNASNIARFGLALVMALAPVPSRSHGGGVNAEGCHTNRKTGEYHCHGGSTYRPRTTSYGEPKRSVSAKAEFRRSHPCPSTGRTSGACRGWEVDHIIPLACGGPDTASNMQWLMTLENRRKGAMGCEGR